MSPYTWALQISVPIQVTDLCRQHLSRPRPSDYHTQLANVGCSEFPSNHRRSYQMSGVDRREFHSNRRKLALSDGAACKRPLLEEASQPEANCSVAMLKSLTKKSDNKSFLCDMSFDYGHYTDEEKEEQEQEQQHQQEQEQEAFSSLLVQNSRNEEIGLVRAPGTSLAT